MNDKWEKLKGKTYPDTLYEQPLEYEHALDQAIEAYCRFYP